MRSVQTLVVLGVACGGPKGDSGAHEDCAEQTWYADLDGDGAFGSEGTVVSCEGRRAGRGWGHRGPRPRKPPCSEAVDREHSVHQGRRTEGVSQSALGGGDPGPGDELRQARSSAVCTPFMGRMQAVSTTHSGVSTASRSARVQPVRGGAGRSSVTTNAARAARVFRWGPRWPGRSR